MPDEAMDFYKQAKHLFDCIREDKCLNVMFHVESLDWWIANGTTEHRKVHKGKNKFESAAIVDEPIPKFDCIFYSIQEIHEMVVADKINLEEGGKDDENIQGLAIQCSCGDYGYLIRILNDEGAAAGGGGEWGRYYHV